MTDSQRARHTTNSHKRRNVLLGTAAVVIVALAGLGIYAYTQLSTVKNDLDAATDNASALQTALESGDQRVAVRSLSSLQDNIGRADSKLGSFVFSAAARLPVLGKNVDAARTITSSLKTVADTGLPSLVDVADQFNGKTFNPRGGAINIAAIAAIGPNVTTSSKVIGSASAEVNEIDASSLLNSLQAPVTEVQDKLRHAARIAERGATASQVVPRMLGGKHTYLLLFQNNAEIRATGGLPGAYAVLNVDDGEIKLGAQGAGASMGNLTYRATAISSEETQLFDTKLVSDFRDVNFTPDFPRAASIGAEIIKREQGVDVDGVLSVDPVTLSYVLKGLGPVTLDDGSTLTADNAVDVLLNGVYVNHPEGQQQDAFFASATQQIFDKVLAGDGDPTALLKALTRATDERRVQVWDRSSDVSDQLAGKAIAGELPRGKAASSTLGFYLNDATGAKMQYYLDYDVAVKATKCSEGGAQTYSTVTTLTSSAPADSATLPESIRGPGFGAQPGSMMMNLYVYAPDRGQVTDLTIDKQDTVSFPSTHDGRGVEQVTVQLDPGETVTVEATVVSGREQRGAARVLTTPSIRPGTKASTVSSAC